MSDIHFAYPFSVWRRSSLKNYTKLKEKSSHIVFFSSLSHWGLAVQSCSNYAAVQHSNFSTTGLREILKGEKIYANLQHRNAILTFGFLHFAFSCGGGVKRIVFVKMSSLRKRFWALVSMGMFNKWRTTKIRRLTFERWQNFSFWNNFSRGLTYKYWGRADARKVLR